MSGCADNNIHGKSSQLSLSTSPLESVQRVNSPKITPQGSIGQCHVRVGPMFSGKTGHLNAELTRWADSTPYSVLRVNYTKDIRETKSVDKKSGITSHSSSFKGFSDSIAIQTVSSIDDVNADNYDVIGIDEAQFYLDIKSYVIKWLHEGKIIYITGLDSYSNGNIAQVIVELLPYASTFSKLTANCRFCMERHIMRPAIMTASNIKKKNDVQIGGLNEYSPVCFECHCQHNVD